LYFLCLPWTGKKFKGFLPTENAEKADGNPIRRACMDFDFIRIFRPFRVLKKDFREFSADGLPL